MTSQRTRVVRTSLSHQIRDALVQQIVSGDLEPGLRLVETKLAQEFGTSQAPVREALRELDSYGLVDVRPRRGTFVGSFVQQTLRESYVVRSALEEAATRVVMMAGTLPVEVLEDDVAEIFNAAKREDAEAVTLNIVSFHRHIIEASGNGLLLRSWESLHVEGRTRVLLTAVPTSLVEVAEEHAALLDGLKSGDIEAACRSAREHQWQFAEVSEPAQREQDTRGTR